MKIYGERNTGTNFVANLLATNLPVDLLPGTPPYWWERQFGLGNVATSSFHILSSPWNLGWKHGIPPAHAWRAPHVFVVLFKNPYSWLLSLHRKPYHNPRAKHLSFSDFLAAPWPSLSCSGVHKKIPSPVVLWNVKNAAYMQFAESGSRCIGVRYEDILADPHAFLTRFADTAGLGAPESTTVPARGVKTVDRGMTLRDYREYYLSERWKKEITDDDLRLINRWLDRALVERLGYTVL